MYEDTVGSPHPVEIRVESPSAAPRDAVFDWFTITLLAGAVVMVVCTALTLL